MNQVTIEQVMQWKLCYSEKRVRECFAGRVSLSWKDIIALNISTEDKLWVLLREEFIPERELYLLACDFAERVLPLTGDPRCAEAIRVKRLWVDGEVTDEELAAARAAAEAAARVAARDAAAARVAARDAQLGMTLDVLRWLA